MDENRVCPFMWLIQRFQVPQDLSFDHLMELHQLLEANAESACDHDDAFHQLRYDLCPECYAKFMQNPVGTDTQRQFNFSQN